MGSGRSRDSNEDGVTPISIAAAMSRKRSRMLHELRPTSRLRTSMASRRSGSQRRKVGRRRSGVAWARGQYRDSESEWLDAGLYRGAERPIGSHSGVAWARGQYRDSNKDGWTPVASRCRTTDWKPFGCCTRWGPISRPRTRMAGRRSASRRGTAEWAIRALHGLEANLETPERVWRLTPVCIAAQYGQVEAVRLLHELGANIETPNEGGRTPVYFAANNGQVETVGCCTRWGPISRLGQ